MLQTETFKFHGLDCAAVTSPGRHWCGYVAVPPSHPLWHKSYFEPAPAPKERLETKIDLDRMGPINVFLNLNGPANTLSLSLLFGVHGGLTYSDQTMNGYPVFVPGAWWFGFDCNHACDQYDPKNLPFVIKELQDLAKQLAEYTAGGDACKLARQGA